jgi:hypothetical protein
MSALGEPLVLPGERVVRKRRLVSCTLEIDPDVRSRWITSEASLETIVSVAVVPDGYSALRVRTAVTPSEPRTRWSAVISRFAPSRDPWWG